LEKNNRDSSKIPVNGQIEDFFAKMVCPFEILAATKFAQSQ